MGFGILNVSLSATGPQQRHTLNAGCAVGVSGDGGVEEDTNGMNLSLKGSVENIGGNAPDHAEDEGADFDEGFDDEFLSNLEILSNMEPYTTAELAAALSNYYAASEGITSNIQNHVEHEFVAKKLNDDNVASSATSDGLRSFGSLLDISTKSSGTWSGSTDFGGKIAWIASLLHRQALIDDGEDNALCTVGADSDEDDRGPCLVGATLDSYVSVRGTKVIQKAEMMLAAEFSILDQGDFFTGNIMDLDCSILKFDTVVANGALAAVDHETDPDAIPMEEMDLVLEKLVSCINPEGGTLWLVGIEEPQKSDQTLAAGAEVYAEITRLYDSVKSLFGEHKKGLSAKWIERTLTRLGLNVYSSTLFPVHYDYEDMLKTVVEVKDWISGLELSSDKPNRGIKKHYRRLLDELKEKLPEEPVFAGEHTYVIAAELPKKKRRESGNGLPSAFEPAPSDV